MTDATVSDIRPALQAPPEDFQSNTTDPPALPTRGDKAKARDLLTALYTLTRIEQQRRPPTPPERQALARFPGFGPLALRLFPDPATGRYRDVTWQQLGEELRALLSPDEYDSARRTTFTAFYTSPMVIRAMHQALARLGVPPQATVLEPGCGTGHFIGEAPPGMRFIGIEIDSLSGRITQVLYPTHDIRLENFRDTQLPQHCIDAVIGNVPFADITYTYHGQRLSLHDFFLAKSLDALKPGGVLALVTSHYTLDKLNPAHRESLAEQADFLGAIRLPSETFKQEGTQVVTDIVFLHKRGPGEAPQHGGDAWLRTEPLTIDGVDIPINAYFLHHPDMVLGAWSRQDRLYGSEATYSLRAASGDLAAQFHAAVARLPEGVYSARTSADPAATPRPLPTLAGQLTEGSFFVADDQAIMQVQGGAAVAVTHGDRPVKADGTLMGRRLAALIALRDQARRVLASQNEGWSEAERQAARRALGRVYDHFVATYGPINKTTAATTREGTVIRRLPNLVKFRDDPDAMLVMSLEDYDDDRGTATKAAIMHQDVVGRTPSVTSVPSAEEGLLVCLNQRGTVDLPFIASLYGAPVAQTTSELGDLIYHPIFARK